MKTTAYCNTKTCRSYKSFRVVEETITTPYLVYRCDDCKTDKTYDYVHDMNKKTLEGKLTTTTLEGGQNW